MKINKIRSIIVAALLMPASLNLYAAAQEFTLDNQHSYVLFDISHFGFSTQSGKWYVNGTVILDKDNPAHSKVNATIKIADIITGLPELDKHLKSKLFFNVEQFPEANFVSDKVEVLNDTTAKVQGKLTLHGVTKPVTLDVTLLKTGKNPINDKITAGFAASTILKRSDFNMNAYVPNIGDEVKINIGAEANLKEEGTVDANKKY